MDTLELPEELGHVKLLPEQLAELDKQVTALVTEMADAGPADERFSDVAERIRTMGNKDIEASASVSSRLLEAPVRAMAPLEGGTEIGKGLIDLRTTIEQLDPSNHGNLLAPRKLFGFIPFGKKAKKYFATFQSSQAHLNAVISSLNNGRTELERDNVSIEHEKISLWQIMERLEKFAYISKKLDAALEAKANEIEAKEPARARAIREDMLFYARQKTTDLMTQIAVNVQGYLALGLVRKNNFELIKGVERATTTTVAALRTAVIVAQALGSQKLVLDQISALNSTTGNMITATSRMLKEQSVAVNQQAASGSVEVEKLQQAFQNIYQTMDAISEFKVKALDSMQKTVQVLSAEVEKSQAYLERSRDGNKAAITADGANV